MSLQTFIYSIQKRWSQCSTFTRSKIELAHQFSTENNVYSRLGEDLATIVVNGIAIWLMLIPLAQMHIARVPSWWTIPMLGIVPWFAILFFQKLRKKSDR